MNVTIDNIKDMAKSALHEQLPLQKADSKNLSINSSDFDNILQNNKSKFFKDTDSKKEMTRLEDNQYALNQIPITFKSEVKQTSSSSQISDFSESKENIAKSNVTINKQSNSINDGQAENLKNIADNPELNRSDKVIAEQSAINSAENKPITKNTKSDNILNNPVITKNVTGINEKLTVKQNKAIEQAIKAGKNLTSNTKINGSAVKNIDLEVLNNAQNPKPVIIKAANSLKTRQVITNGTIQGNSGIAQGSIASTFISSTLAPKKVQSNSTDETINSNSEVSESKDKPTKNSSGANISPLYKNITMKGVKPNISIFNASEKKSETTEITKKSKNILSTETSSLTSSKAKQNSSKINTVLTVNDVLPNEIASTTAQIIRNLPDNSIHTARLILKPESLGTVFVEISLNDKALTINFKADNKEVIKSMENQLPALKEKLSQMGLTTESVEFGLNSENFKGQEKGETPGNSKQKQDDKTLRQAFARSFADSAVTDGFQVSGSE
jgi:flagellar hook-length control protein FliK